MDRSWTSYIHKNKTDLSRFVLFTAIVPSGREWPRQANLSTLHHKWGTAMFAEAKPAGSFCIDPSRKQCQHHEESESCDVAFFFQIILLITTISCHHCSPNPVRAATIHFLSGYIYSHSLREWGSRCDISSDRPLSASFPFLRDESSQLCNPIIQIPHCVQYCKPLSLLRLPTGCKC